MVPTTKEASYIIVLGIVISLLAISSTEKALLTVNKMETRSNMGIKKKYDRMRQCIITKFHM